MSYSRKTVRFNKKLAGKTVRVQELESGELFYITILSVNKGYSAGNILWPESPVLVQYYPNKVTRRLAKQNWYLVYKEPGNDKDTFYQFVEESTLKKFMKQKP